MRTAEERDEIFGLIIRSVQENAKRPIELSPSTNVTLDDNEIFLMLCELIAYSGQVRSEVIYKRIIETEILKRALNFGDYGSVAKINPEEFLNRYWREIRVIRFRWKAKNMIAAAKVMQKIVKEHGSFSGFLNEFDLPKRLETESDIDKFWQRTDQILEAIKEYEMPSFKNVTSLMHLLDNLGYPCLKPDSTVMKILYNVGLIEKGRGERILRQAVRTIQEYCVGKDITPKVMDRYLLIFGGQSDWKDYIEEPFCNSSKGCDKLYCLIRKYNYCVIAKGSS